MVQYFINWECPRIFSISIFSFLSNVPWRPERQLAGPEPVQPGQRPSSC